MLVKLLNIKNVFIDVEKAFSLGCSGEKDGGISSTDGVINKWWLVIFSGLNLLNVTN